MTKSSFEKRKSHHSSIGIPLVKANNNTLISTFSDDAQQFPTMATSVDYFDYDIIMHNKKKNKIKKHTLILLKHFLIVMKKNKDESNKLSIESNRSTFNAIGIKCFIPLRKLFVSNIDYHYVINNQNYCQLSLVSTVLFKRRSFTFLFDNSSTFS